MAHYLAYHLLAQTHYFFYVSKIFWGSYQLFKISYR
jgi:hypothetical protein